MLGLIGHFRPDYVAHLGAQPGVRHSTENPAAYVHSNLVGFASVLDGCRRHPPKHLVYASSSSVYGAGARPPFREDDDTNQPTSFYGATKKSNELMAHSYAAGHGLNVTGLRFFTAYGPWGRPDMAPTLFARAICEGRTLPLFNHGKNLRDFTYIDDIVTGVVKTLLYPHEGTPLGGIGQRHPDQPPARIFNLGHHRPVETLLFVRMLEQLLGRPAQIELLPAQPGDMAGNLRRPDPGRRGGQFRPAGPPRGRPRPFCRVVQGLLPPVTAPRHPPGPPGTRAAQSVIRAS